MKDFFSQLKEVFIREANEDHKFDACGYFETIMQHKDRFQVIVDEGEKYDFYIVLTRRDDADDYGMNNVKVYLQNDIDDFTSGGANYHYQIILEHDERLCGYCECEPDTSMYNEQHRCCGMGCDWVAPMVSVCKIETIGRYAYDGYEKDMWKLQEDWSSKMSSVEEKKKQDRLIRIQQEIERLQNEQENLLKTT